MIYLILLKTKSNSNFIFLLKKIEYNIPFINCEIFVILIAKLKLFIILILYDEFKRS